MEKYSEYKDSGVQWLGEIPGHWEVVKGKNFINILFGFPFDSQLFGFYGFPLIRIRDITSGKIETYYNGSYNDKYIVHKNDLLVGMDGDFNVRWWENEEALLNQRCCKIVTSNRVNLRFIYYALPIPLRTINELANSTTVKHLGNDDIKNISFALPPREEQDAMVEYLDKTTAKIDEAIRQQQRMIELLNERKQIIINNAVTKGLNPNVKMKDSGVEWIGEIPEHWDFCKLKNLTSIISKGTTPSTIGREIFENGEIRFLKAENIVDNIVSNTPEFYIDERTHIMMKRSNLQENDILFVIAGATIGKVAVLQKELTPANTNQAISFIRLIDKNSVLYIWYVLQSNLTKKYIWQNAVQSAQPNISMEDLGNIQIPLPKAEEQSKIIDFIEQSLRPIDEAVKIATRQITLLQERKQIIINDVVTGKVKVS